MWWTGRNCDLCVKASHLRESVAGEEYTAFRCAINKEITLECAGMIENVSQRTYDICQKADCPYRQTEWNNIVRSGIERYLATTLIKE